MGGTAAAAPEFTEDNMANTSPEKRAMNSTESSR
jgi:hypothetical protein